MDSRYVTHDILKKEISKGVDEIWDRFAAQENLKARLDALQAENARLKALHAGKSKVTDSEAPSKSQALEYHTPVAPHLKTIKIKNPTPRDTSKYVSAEVVPLEREKGQARKYRSTPKPVTTTTTTPKVTSTKGPYRFDDAYMEDDISSHEEQEDVRALIKRRKRDRETSSMDARKIIEIKKERNQDVRLILEKKRTERLKQATQDEKHSLTGSTPVCTDPSHRSYRTHGPSHSTSRQVAGHPYHQELEVRSHQCGGTIKAVVTWTEGMKIKSWKSIPTNVGGTVKAMVTWTEGMDMFPMGW